MSAATPLPVPAPASRRVLFAAGGTAGHVFPGLAVAQALVEADPGIEPVFVGTRDRLEGELVPKAGFPFHHVEMVPAPRRLSPALLRLPLSLRAAVRRCMRLLRELEAVAAITFGGYVSYPLARAARSLGLPLVIHEQNAVPGLANRLAGRWADRVAVSFPGSADYFPHPERVAVTGNPVRHEILVADQGAMRPECLRRFKLHQRRRTLLAFGGSQGARRINEAVVASNRLWKQPNRLQILHAAGQDLYPETVAMWEQAQAHAEGPLVRCVDFIDDMAAAYTCADVVLCRAGATSIAELTALGKPSVLVPYPHATGDHQRHNAEALQGAGAARVIVDEELSGPALVEAVEPLLEDEEVRSTAAASARAFGRLDAADNVARLVLGVLLEPSLPPPAPPAPPAPRSDLESPL